MRAVVIERPHEAVFREVETPACGPGDVLVRSRLAGVCRTDLEVLEGELDRRWVNYPCIPGHEWSGVVEQVGEGVPDLSPGDRVVCEGFCYCGICRRCRAGDTNLCESYDQLGFTRGGGYGELVLAPRRVVHRLPENVPLDAAVLIEPGSVVLKGLLRARPAPGETIGVVGVGTLGALTIVLAKLFAPAAIVAYGIREAELELARSLGASEAIDVSGGSAAHEGELDLVVETAGAVPAVELATRLPREGGRIVALGIAGAGRELCVPADRFALRDLELIGSVGYTTAVWTQLVELLGAGLVDLSPVIAKRIPAERFEDAFRIMARRTASSAASSSSTHDRRSGCPMIDRSSFLRRAGASAAGVSLSGLLGPAAALASGGGDFPDHRAGGSPSSAMTRSTHSSSPRSSGPRTRLHSSAARCSGQARPVNSADETARGLRSAVAHKADGIAVSLPDAPLFGSALEAARQAKVPVVAFGLGAGNGRVPFVGQDPVASGERAGEELARLARSGSVLLIAPATTRTWQGARLAGLRAVLGGRAAVVGSQATCASWRPRSRRAPLRPGGRRARPCELGRARERAQAVGTTGPCRRIRLLPNDLTLVTGGQLAFVVDQQPYVQGFSPVMQLFLARISEGTVTPSSAETSILLRKADVQPFVATKSRFEGSSSRHEYPLRRV